MKKGFSIPRGGFCWQTETGFHHLAGSLDSALKEPTAEAVKASGVRAVFMLPAEGDRPALVVKVYKTRGILAAIRTLLLGPPARREWTTLERLKEKGVAVPQRAAVSAGCKGRLRSVSCLATLAIEGASTLEDILQQRSVPPVPPRSLAQRVGELVRSMHDAGIQHKDLHAANILIDPSGTPYLLDLHGAKRMKHLTFEHRTRDLVSLAGAFIMHGRRTDRLRFFKAYSRGLFPESLLKTKTKEIEQRAWDHLFTFLRRFEKRVFRPGRRFFRIKTPTLNGIAERSEQAHGLVRFLGPRPHELLEEKGNCFHQSAGTRVFELQWEKGRYIVKMYLRGGFRNGINQLFLGSRAGRAWLNYFRLLYRGLAVPRPILFLEESCLSPARRSYIVSVGIPGCSTLDRYVATATRASILNLIHDLASKIARMHRLFLRNRDLKAQNILVTTDGKILMIDPDGVHSLKEPSLHIMARDLMRLNASFPPLNRQISLTDRLRFLKVYMTHMFLPPSRTRELWRETLDLTLDKWATWKRRSKGP